MDSGRQNFIHCVCCIGGRQETLLDQGPTNLQTSPNQKLKPTITGADANVHHTIWGSLNTNIRVESIQDFILKHNLVVLNMGSETTFVV